MKNKKLTIKLDASTWRWLRALARANSNTDMQSGECTAEELLEQAAFCMADAAGRRTGSWEADVAQRMLDSSGFQQSVGWPATESLHRWDEEDNAKHTARWAAMSPEQKADYWKMTGKTREDFIAGLRKEGAQ